MEIPAGLYDRASESPEETMRREAREETGLEVSRLDRLGSILTSPGFSDERVDLFLAWSESPIRPDARAERELEVLTMEPGEALRAVTDGTIEDAKTAVALLIAAARLGWEASPGPGGRSRTHHPGPL